MSTRAVLIAVGVVVSAGFAYVAVRNAHLHEVWTALSDSSYGWLAPAFACLGAWFCIRVERWRSLFAPATRPPFDAAGSALFVGYVFNALLPVRAGEPARIVALNRRAGSSLAETTATVVIERVFDVLSLLVLLFVALPWLPHLTWIRAAAVFAAAIAVVLAALVAGLAVFGDRPFAFAFRQLGRLPFLSEQRLHDSPANFLRGLRGLRRPRTALVAFAWTTLSWIVLGVGSWFVMVAFHLGLSPLAGELVVIGVGLALILPSSPAALGVFEGATVVVLSAYGVSDSEALSYALVLHALNVLPFLLLAPFVLRPYGSLLTGAADRDARPADVHS